MGGNINILIYRRKYREYIKKTSVIADTTISSIVEIQSLYREINTKGEGCQLNVTLSLVLVLRDNNINLIVPNNVWKFK